MCVFLRDDDGTPPPTPPTPVDSVLRAVFLFFRGMLLPRLAGVDPPLALSTPPFPTSCPRRAQPCSTACGGCRCEMGTWRWHCWSPCLRRLNRRRQHPRTSGAKAVSSRSRSQAAAKIARRARTTTLRASRATTGAPLICRFQKACVELGARGAPQVACMPRRTYTRMKAATSTTISSATMQRRALPPRPRRDCRRGRQLPLHRRVYRPRLRRGRQPSLRRVYRRLRRAPSNAPTRAPSKSPTRTPSTPPTPSQSAACDAAAEACRADDSTCGGCLDVDLKNQPLRAALTVLSGLSGLAQSACTGTPQAHLGAVLRRCPLLTASNSTGCLDAMLNCSRQAGGPGDCRGLIVPAAGPSGGQAFAAIDYTRVLDATLNELQYACRNDFRPAGHGDGTGSFPVLPAHWSCASGVSACANDPGCWGCFTAYQQVSSMEMIGLDALTRCTSATGYLQLNRVLASCNQTVPEPGHFSEHSANSSTAAEFYYSQLPQACLKHGWACTTDSTSGCDRCMLSVGNTALRPAHGAQPTLSEWHATFTSSDCRGAMQSQGDVDDDHHPGDDDLYAGYGLAYDATDFGRAMAYCSRPGENIPGGSQRNLVCIYQSLLCDDTDSCRVCLGGPPTATSVPVKGGSRCKDPLSVITRFCPPDYVHFMKCPEKVAINNRLVMATSVFGFISTAAVVCTLAVIYGYRKDQSSLRERILTGVFAGNLLYSVVNMIPIAVEETDAAICGDPYYVESQSLVCGLWFGAKYTSTCPPSLPCLCNTC